MSWYVLYGLAFGVGVGGIMRLPGMDAVVPAFAINLCVMTALWLGIAIANSDRRPVTLAECGVGLLTFVLAAAALRTTPTLLYAGFALQALWSLAHLNQTSQYRFFAVRAPAWFSPFAAAANVGFGLVLSALVGWP
ncbi:MAG: hypothetical protein AAGM04_08125 [Pseudomonadota bacterium]